MSAYSLSLVLLEFIRSGVNVGVAVPTNSLAFFRCAPIVLFYSKVYTAIFPLTLTYVLYTSVLLAQRVYLSLPLSPSRLVIQEVNVAHRGDYICRATNPNINDPQTANVFSGEVTVKVEPRDLQQKTPIRQGNMYTFK